MSTALQTLEVLTKNSHLLRGCLFSRHVNSFLRRLSQSLRALQETRLFLSLLSSLVSPYLISLFHYQYRSNLCSSAQGEQHKATLARPDPDFISTRSPPHRNSKSKSKNKGHDFKMTDKFPPPTYPPPSHSPGPGYQCYQSSPPPPPNAMVYGPNQGQYEGNRGYFGQQQQQPYGPPQGYGYGYGQGYPQQQQPPNVIYERESGGGGGICAGLLAGLACCCCLECLF